MNNIDDSTQNNETTTTIVSQIISSTDEQPDILTTTTTTTEPVVVTETKNMQSFEEWKEMKIKEERRVAQAAAASTEDHQSNNQPNKNNKEQIIMKKNFASMECGAKILSSNPESSNPSHILTESRDDYMLNSCSNKIWFIIELCEPIKLNEIEIANFELFSNTPKQFSVYASERYPTKNWTKNFIGTFDAAAVRSIQLFNIKKSNNHQQQQQQEDTETTAAIIQDIYVKYIKFEMLSHYGNEHYCPLSLVRLYGTSMDDDVVQNIEDNDRMSEKIKINQNLTAVELPPIVSKQTTTTTVAPVSIKQIDFLTKLTDNIVKYYIRGPRQKINDQVLESILCSFSKVNLNCCQCEETRGDYYCSYYFLILTKYRLKQVFADQLMKQFRNQSENNLTKIVLNEIGYFVSDDLFYSFDNDHDKLIEKTTTTSTAKLIISSSLSSIEIQSSPTNESKTPEELTTTTTAATVAANEASVIEESSSNESQIQTTTTTTGKNVHQIGNTNAGKDVIFMRLNNRIQALEINMSLSSQYLEQLSQHYRKQIDEMQKLFNRTTNALIDANKMSEERDSKQSERIKLIEKRLDSLQNNVNLYYYYINSFNNLTSGVNNKLTTESKNSDDDDDDDDGDESCHHHSSKLETVENSLNFYLKKLNYETSSFFNFKFEFLVLTLFFTLLLNACVVCIVVLVCRQRYLLLKINLYENNKIYLKSVIEDQFKKYINEQRISGSDRDRGEIIENLTFLPSTSPSNQLITKPTITINNNQQRGDFIQQQQQNQANAAAVAVLAAVAFAATNHCYNEQQQTSNSTKQNLQSSLATTVT